MNQATELRKLTPSTRDLFEVIRSDFAILQQKNRNKDLIYFDNASTTQKPNQVLRAINDFYKHDYANIHRGIYELSERATTRYEDTRKQVAHYIGARHEHEIVFVRNTTEAINLVAQTWGKTQLKKGDEIILSEMEHHSNIVPWHLLREQLGLNIRVIPVHDDGSLDLAKFEKLLTSRTKLVAVTQVSNTLGTINSIHEMTTLAHRHGVLVLVDGAQAVAHLPVSVSEIDCDFYAFSSHKLYGPTGVGVLYAKEELLAAMPPYQGGGSMIHSVSFDEITYAPPPQRFEAGTPNIAGVAGLGAAIYYLNNIGMDSIAEKERYLLEYATQQLKTIAGLTIYGTTPNKAGIIAFNVDGIHPHDLATMLDHEGIAARAGHHCTMPLMARFNVAAMMRVSFAIYNQEQEIDALVAAIHMAKRFFGSC